MKAFICLLVLVAGANAGFLLGLGDGGYAGGSGSYGGGHGSYGGGHVSYGGGHGGHGGHVETRVIKVIHEEAPVVHHAPAPAIIKVIHEENQHHQHHVEAAPQIVRVIHEEHAHAAPAPVVHHVKLIHEHEHHDHGHGHGHDIAPEVKIIKVIRQEPEHHHVSHGWA